MNIGSVGIVGYGAFGKLLAQYLCKHFCVYVNDIDDAILDGIQPGIIKASIQVVGECDAVILAVPVDEISDTIRSIKGSLKPGGIVFDVCSVKSVPALIMQNELPAHVDIIGTHPLFGPQSARSGIRGLKIALCPVRSTQVRRVAAFLRRALGLKVLIVSPEEHDVETAFSQALTHLIARVLIDMEPLPNRVTTASFDLLKSVADMVRYDSNAVFVVIQRTNPHSAAIRSKFIRLAAALDSLLVEDRAATNPNYTRSLTTVKARPIRLHAPNVDR